MRIIRPQARKEKSISPATATPPDLRVTPPSPTAPARRRSFFRATGSRTAAAASRHRIHLRYGQDTRARRTTRRRRTPTTRQPRPHPSSPSALPPAAANKSALPTPPTFLASIVERRPTAGQRPERLAASGCRRTAGGQRQPLPQLTEPARWRLGSAPRCSAPLRLAPRLRAAPAHASSPRRPRHLKPMRDRWEGPGRSCPAPL